MTSWQEVAKNLVGVGIIGLFSWLFLLAGMSYTHSEDIVCNELECEAFINVTTTYWRICFAHYNGTKYWNETLFKKVSRSRTLHVNLDKVDNIIKTEPPIPVDWYVPARGKGNWRPLKDGDCWDRLKTNKIKLVGHPTESQTIKWSFKVSEVDIDPVWVSWEIIYENLSKQIPIFKTTEIKEVINPNGSTTSAYNKTSVSHYKTAYYKGDRLGTKVNGTKYLNSNVDGNNLIEWKYEIGDRNFKEYGNCRIHELEKGVCKETELI